MSAPDDLVVAVGLGLRTTEGPVLTDLHLSWPPATLIAVTGPAGSGRSSLLLAVAGRVRGLSGRLTVAGVDAIAASGRLRAITSIGRITDLVELEGRLTVAESITERALIDAVSPQRAEAGFAAATGKVGVEVPRDRLIDELPALEQAVLAAVLATLRPSRLIVLDDADARLDLAGQRRLFEALALLATSTGTAIVVSTTETAALPADVPRLDLPRSAAALASEPAPSPKD